MNHTQFDVSRFENRNGSISWRVTGWLHGLRVRKNFKSREEAAAEKAMLEIKALQATSCLRSIATPLTDEQVREAEAAFQRLADKPRPLTFYLDFALANYREPENQKQLADAITDYNAAKKHEFEQAHISEPQLDRIGWDLKRLEEHFHWHEPFARHRLKPQSTHRHCRATRLRGVSRWTRTVDPDASRMDPLEAYSTSPSWAFHLLRPIRGCGAYSHKTEDSSPRLALPRALT